MTNLSYLLPLLDLFKKNSDFSSALEESKKIIKQTLHEEVLAVSLKVFTGLVVTSLIITSLVIVGQQVNDLLLTQDNGPYLSITVFSVLAALSIGALIYLFKSKTKERKVVEAVSNGIDLQKTLTSFLAGLSEGMESAKSKREPLGSSTESVEIPNSLTTKPLKNSYNTELSA